MSSSHYSIAAFDESVISFSTKNKKWMAIGEECATYSILLRYIAANRIELESPSQSYSASILPAKNKSKDRIGSALCGTRVMLNIGYGEFAFRSNTGEKMFAVHQHQGDPVGTSCGAKLLSSLVLFSDESIEVLGEFVSWLVDKSEETDEGSFTCYGWHIRHHYWRMEAKIRSRPMDSVVLPQATKQLLVRDIEKFLRPSTQEFYNRNGIPYRRSYLFYGVPGTGKTSMVQALAGYFQRSVCYLMPTHPEMTDDSLRDAMNRLPDDAIVVFEDIDALFSKARENKVTRSALTFSGLLNALDGIGNPNGQIFVLTTNLRDELDHALIRNGRVDMHVGFSYATAEQMEMMFRNFYPEAAASASVVADAADDAAAVDSVLKQQQNLPQLFAERVVALLAKHQLQVTTSGLQHYFVSQMDASAEEAAQNVNLIVAAIQQNSSQEMLAAAATAAAAAAASGAEEVKDAADIKTK